MYFVQKFAGHLFYQKRSYLHMTPNGHKRGITTIVLHCSVPPLYCPSTELQCSNTVLPQYCNTLYKHCTALVLHCNVPTLYCPSTAIPCTYTVLPQYCNTLYIHCTALVLQYPVHTLHCPSTAIPCTYTVLPQYCNILYIHCTALVLHCTVPTVYCPSTAMHNCNKEKWKEVQAGTGPDYRAIVHWQSNEEHLFKLDLRPTGFASGSSTSPCN